MPVILINGVAYSQGDTIRMNSGAAYQPGTNFNVAGVAFTNPPNSVTIQLSAIGSPTSVKACQVAFNFGTLKLFTEQVFKSIYTDQNLTNTFNGNGFWYYTDNYNGMSGAIQVGNDGRILDFVPC
jgi:hypothetical protein